MTIRTALLLLVPLTAATIHASQKWELNTGYHGMDWYDFTASDFSAGGRFFLDPMGAGGPEPLAEAEFVERPRTIEFAITLLELENQPDTYDRDETAYALGYTHRRPDSPHAFSLGFEHAEASTLSVGTISDPPWDGPLSDFEVESDTDTVRLGYHYYLRPRMTIGLEGRAERETEHFTNSAFRYDRFQLDLVGRVLHPLGNDRWLMLRASVGRSEAKFTWERQGEDLSSSDTTTDYSATAAIYFSRHTSLSLTGTHDGMSDTDEVALGLRHFFNERVALGANVGRVFTDSEDDGTTYGGALTVRF